MSKPESAPIGNDPDPIPLPAHPHRRREPLPWQHPKSAEEDPDAPRRVQAILNSPSYRQADRDVNFLNLDETRGVRLQIDYAKPEFLLQQHGVQHTIVVFGSTRIPEPTAAQRHVETLTLIQTRTIRPVPVVLVGEHYWRRAFDVDFLVDEGVIDPEDRELFCYAETAQEIWQSILGWHEANGTPLFPCG